MKCPLCEDLRKSSVLENETWEAHLVLLAVVLIGYRQGTPGEAKLGKDSVGELMEFINNYHLAQLTHDNFMEYMDNPEQFYNKHTNA